MRKWLVPGVAVVALLGGSASASGGSGVWLIKIIAGGPDHSSAYSGDGGPALKAGFGATAIALDGNGNIYVADGSNQRVRKINRAGIITTVAGGGTTAFKDGIPATSARLFTPSAVAVDARGDIFVAEPTNGTYSDVREVSPSGTITTVVGGPNNLPSKGPVPATKAWLSGARALAFDKHGNLYVADVAHVLKVTPDGVATTFAGSWEQNRVGYSGDGGPATNALLAYPSALAVDAAGSVYITDGATDYARGRVRKVTPDGTIKTFAKGKEGPALAVDKQGNVYAEIGYPARTLRKFTSAGRLVSTIAGGPYGTYKDGPARKTMFGMPAIAIDGQGNIYGGGGTWLVKLYRQSPAAPKNK